MFMVESRVWLSSVKIIKQSAGGGDRQDITSKHKFLKGLISNLDTAMRLFFTLHSEGLIKYLKTRSLTSDCLENAFAEMRSQCGNNRRPSPFQMKIVFRHAAMY